MRSNYLRGTFKHSFDEELKELLPFISQRRFIIFIGAGISKKAGCYGWDSILKEMFESISFKKGSFEDLKKSGEDPNILMEFCYKKLAKEKKENLFWKILKKAITPNPYRFVNEYISFVKKIRDIKPLPSIVTTNVDSCLEDSRVFEDYNCYYKLKDMKIEHLRNSKCILHIHGYREDFEHSLLVPWNYKLRYEKPSFRKFVKKMFSEYAILFLGYSFRDSDLKKLSIEAAREKSSDIKHFLLVSEEDRFSRTDGEIFLEMCKIKIINYGPVDGFDRLFSNWVKNNFQKLES